MQNHTSHTARLLRRALTFFAIAFGLLAPAAHADTVSGGWVNGANFEIGSVGTTNPANNWPAAESPDKAVDGDANTKFLLFQGSNAGIIITPTSPAAYNTLALTTAGDAPERDPANYKIYGSATALPTSGNIPIASVTLLGEAPISLTATRNFGAEVAYFKNTTAYASYVVVFPTVKNSPPTTITQIAEVGLLQRATPDVRINEVDSDTPGFDAAEFVELYGPPNASLDGLVLAFLNGANDLSYRTYDLDGFSLDANGFFLVGSAAVPGVDVIIPDNTLQNGADAVALYRAPSYPILAFPYYVIGGYLVDAIVYDTDDADDSGLIAGLGVDWGLPVPVQYNENANSLFESQSVSRSVDGGSTIVTQNATPGAPNSAATAPVVTTATQSGVTATSATLGGEVTADGGAAVTDRGIVWNTTGTPTTADTKVANGTGTGVFSATVGSLPPNTTIHVRAYATNSVNTSYGAAISFATPSLVLPTVVTTIANSGAGSLRQAVLNANANPGADAITFDPTVFATAQTIVVSALPPTFAMLVLTGDTTITGPAAGVTVEAVADSGDLFTVGAGSTVSFSGLTMTGSGSSNAILNNGTLTVSNCMFTSPPRGPDGDSSGIQNNHIATVTGCTFGSAGVLQFGGAFSNGGSLTVSDSLILNCNQGVINGGTATLSGCTIDNEVGVEYGSMRNYSGALTLTNCSIMDRSGYDGLFFVDDGTLLFQNCTLIENSPATGSTNAGTVTMKNTIYRRHAASAAFTDGGGNLLLNRTGTTAPALAADLTALGLDPTGLQNNGGPTKTIALLSGTAINGGVPANVPGGVTTDQRGSGFARSVGTVDIGAYEHPSPVQLVATTASAAEGTGAGTTAFTFTVTRPGATTDAVTVNYAITGTGPNPANAADFGGTLPSGTLTLPIGVASDIITIAVAKDATIETDETFTLTLSNPTANHAIAGNGAVATIANDDFNANPTFSGYAFSTPKNTPASVAVAKILARAADSDGGTLALTAVSATSAQGGSVSRSGGNVTYTPENNDTGLDTFTVTISDGQGGSVVGTITVSITDGSGAGKNQAKITVLPGGNVALLFMGIPGQEYVIERSTDMTNWTPATTVTAAADGTIPYTDTNPPPGGSAFYRTAVPQN